MKKKYIVFAIIIAAAAISVTSGCAMGNGYQYHFNHTWRGY